MYIRFNRIDELWAKTGCADHEKNCMGARWSILNTNIKLTVVPYVAFSPDVIYGSVCSEKRLLLISCSIKICENHNRFDCILKINDILKM